MYRIIGKYAVELLTSGRNEEDEYNEMIEFASQGDDTFIITDDYEEYGAELIERDSL